MLRRAACASAHRLSHFLSPLGSTKDQFTRDFGEVDFSGPQSNDAVPNNINVDELRQNTGRGIKKLIGQPILNVRQHYELLGVCSSVLYNLRPSFVGVGSTVKCVTGPVGCGKSTVLTGFVHALPLLRPHIIPLYVDVHAHFNKGKDIGKTIAQEIALIAGMSADQMQALDPMDMFLYGARAAAALHGKYVFLVLDNIEAVWWKNASATERTLCDEAYALLGHLANTGHGGWGTLACSWFPELRKLIVNEPISDARFTPRRSLNGTKCPTIHLATASPGDTGPAAEFVACMMSLPVRQYVKKCNLMPSLVKYVVDECDTNPRAAAHLLKQLEVDIMAEIERGQASAK